MRAVHSVYDNLISAKSQSQRCTYMYISTILFNLVLMFAKT